LLAVTAICVHAETVDECILQGLKGVNSDAAAKMIEKSCKNKVSTINANERKSRFGSPMSKGEWELTNGIESASTGSYSKQIKNNSANKIITYIKMNVKDGDYYSELEKIKKKRELKNGGCSTTWDCTLGSISSIVELENEKTKDYFYTPNLKPGESAKFIYKSNAESMYIDIVEVYARG
jgi:hypothetical protein